MGRMKQGSLLHLTNLNNQGGIFRVDKEATIDLGTNDKWWNYEMFLFQNMMWFTLLSLLLTTITITANLTPHLIVTRPEPWPLWNWKNHKLSDTFIVKDIFLLNTIYAVIMASGLISVVLIYMQIVRPFNPQEKGENKEEHLLNGKGEHKDLDFPKSKFFI